MFITGEGGFNWGFGVCVGVGRLADAAGNFGIRGKVLGNFDEAAGGMVGVATWIEGR